MAEHRPFPPSPRRRSLARQAGLHAASPFVVGAIAAGAALIATIALAGSLVQRLGAAIAAACSQRAVLEPSDLPGAVAGIALPIAGAATAAALIAHLAQTRAAWLPRRRIAGAPAVDAGAGPRTRRATGELAAAIAIAGVAFGWLWWAAPHLAALISAEPAAAATAASSHLLGAAAALLVHLGIALVVAWLVLGVLDALARHGSLGGALRMTSAEKREDDRLAGADPRWRARRAQIHRGPTASDAVAGASVLVLGDNLAVAIAWDPVRRPIPIRTAAGRGPRATQLLGLARRHHIAVHRDAALAAALASASLAASPAPAALAARVTPPPSPAGSAASASASEPAPAWLDTGDTPIPDAYWPRLAEIIAATRGRDRTR